LREKQTAIKGFVWLGKMLRLILSRPSQQFTITILQKHLFRQSTAALALTTKRNEENTKTPMREIKA